MLNFTVIGNLGADAHVENVNGRKFVSFSVADSQRWVNEKGEEQTALQWVSVAWDGDGGKLLEHLKKGRLVYVEGRGSVRCYSSPKTHRFEAGANISARRIELLGSGNTDDVPRRLYSTDGIEFPINKAYYITQEQAKSLGASKTKVATLVSQDGRQFEANGGGWVYPKQVQEQADGNNEQTT